LWCRKREQKNSWQVAGPETEEVKNSWQFVETETAEVKTAGKLWRQK
jgi:hypothetical protein